MAKKRLADTEISEAEEYLGLLRTKKAAIELCVGEADEQIRFICEVLDEHGIPEIPSSDDEAALSDSFSLPPPSSSSLDDDHCNQLCSDPEEESPEDPIVFTKENAKEEHQRVMEKLVGKGQCHDIDQMSDYE